MAKHVPRKSKFASEAAAQTLLRFGPQQDALTELQKTAEGAYATSIAQAKGNADSTVATVDKAIPAVGQIYGQAAVAHGATNAIVNRDIAGLNLSPDLRAAVGLEQADSASRITSGQANAQAGLQQQRVAARAGGQFAANKAHDDLVSTLSKIFDQRTSLGSQAGTFQSLTTQQLTDKAQARADTLASQAASRAQSNTNSIRASGIDPATGKPIPGGKLDPKKKHGQVSATGKKLNPAGAHATARQAIATAVGALKNLDPDRTDRHETAPLLVNGHKSQPLYDTVPAPTTANPKATKTVPRVKGGVALSTPDVPGVGEWATIAADVYYDGHLSRANQRILANNGYSIKQLGLPTYAQWKKSHPAAKRSTSNYLGGAGAGSGST